MFSKPSVVEFVSVEQVKHIPRQEHTKSSSQMSKCKVCGDQARIINYGALACQPCKTFFRRNALHPEHLPRCINNASCDIDKYTRRFCSSCRLAKCISKGMSSDFIRKEEIKSNRCSSTYMKNIRTMYKSTKASKRSHLEQYLLLGHQQKTLFNISHALEIFSATPKVREIIDDELAFIFDLPFDASSAIECINHISTSIQSFINSLPDFRVMAMGEKSSLFHRNCNGVTCLYSTMVFRQTGIIHRPDLITSFVSIYGSEMMLELVQISKELDADLTLIKLMLVILAFSSNYSMVDYQTQTHFDNFLTGTFRLFGSQNEYVTILWKYTVCKYGYYKAVGYFSQLIQFSIKLIESSAMAYMNHEPYHRLVDALNQNRNQSLVGNQHEHICLCGTV